MKRNISESSPLVNYVTYKLGNITYLPHYRNWNVFVGPGYPRTNRRRYTAAELVNAGAKSADQMLWPRSEHGIITDGNL